MEKKYIINLEEKETAYKTVNSNGWPMIQLLHTAPYTEPDINAIRKEAYDNGFDDGRNKCASREFCMKEAYQKGLAYGRRIERENIFKTLEKVSDGNADYDKLTLGECRIILGINKRMQKRKEGE